MIKKIIKKLFSNNKRIDYSNLIVDIDDDSKEYIKLVSRYALKGELEIWAIISSFRNVLNQKIDGDVVEACLLYTSPSPRDRTRSRMPSSA